MWPSSAFHLPQGRRKKRMVVLGGAHHKVGDPAVVVVKLPLIVGGIFFGLESPDTEK